MDRVRQRPRGAGSSNLFQRARDWADARGIPVYSHLRGLFLLARSLKADHDDVGPDGRSRHPATPDVMDSSS